ncbi:MAG: flavodoxin domain-containing protein [Firmicutes bacterium]|nr:flavodoxin domain-containing protein [Bacillota bacterium]
MKTIMVYKSNSGYVKKYADMISSELKCDIREGSKVSLDQLKNYDIIIFGGGLYAVGINGIKLLKNNIDSLVDKKIVVFASGASPFREEVYDEVINKNFTLEQQELIKFFYLRGGFDFKKLKLRHKVVMKGMKMHLSKKDELTEDEAGMLAAFDKPVDFTSKENAQELIDYVKSIRGF